MTLRILHHNIITPRLNSYTIIPTLINEIRQLNVIHIHSIKPISILHPILSKRRLSSRSITGNILKHHIRPIHNIQTPERRLVHVEVAHSHITDVPPDEGHRAAGLSVAGFGGVPDVAVAEDTACAIAVDVDVVAGQNEACGVVLEGDGVVVGWLAPVVDIGAVGPFAAPLYCLRGEFHQHTTSYRFTVLRNIPHR